MCEIELCLGSACYARGNGELMNKISRYIDENGLDGLVSLKGTLCCGTCKGGPVIIIDGITHEGIGSSDVFDMIESRTGGIEV